MSNKVIIGIVVVLVVILAIWFYMQNGTSTSVTGEESMTSTSTEVVTSSDQAAVEATGTMEVTPEATN